MAKKIKSLDDLNKILETRLQRAMQKAQDTINECIQESINEYYKEKVFRKGTSAIPTTYERTYKLLNSLVKTEIFKNGNTYSCQVKIDESYLNYSYPGSGMFSNLPATGKDVLRWNNEDGSHGGTVDGEWRIWDEAMRTLSGESGIMSIFIQKIKNCGIPVNHKNF